MAFEMGSKARDKITGFDGVVTGKASYITGCDQYLVQPPLDKDGKHVESRWYDEQRLELVPAARVELVNDRAGADSPAPVK